MNSSDLRNKHDMHFSINQQSKESLEVMNCLRNSDSLCDIVLNVERKRFKAHRLVLAAASPYFLAMLTKGMKEEHEDEICLYDVQSSTVELLINYAYTAEIAISENNVSDLLQAANMYQMTHIVDSCCTFLEHRLDPFNCIGIMKFSIMHDCNDLSAKATNYLYRNFCHVRKSQEFLLLSFNDLREIINNDDLCVSCESEVYESVIDWVKFNLDDRMNHLNDLIHTVRCLLLSPVFLQKQITYCPVLKKSPECSNYLAKIVNDLKLHRHCTEKSFSRKANCRLIIYVLGGYLRHSLATAECYDPQNKSWLKLTDLPSPLSGLACVFCNDKLYVIGGRNNSANGSIDSAQVYCYEPLKNMWKNCSNMNVPRHRPGSCVVDGQIYVIGGSHLSNYHSSCEKYDALKDEWVYINPMSTKRMGVGVSQVDRLIYAIGGKNEQERLSTVERYCPDRNTWHYISPMPTPRSGAGITVYEQFIFVIGGYDSEMQLNIVERYDTINDQWCNLKPMLSARSVLSCCVINDKLFAFGGFDSNDILDIVEVYDLKNDCWSTETRMLCGRSGHSSVVGLFPKIV